MKCYIHIQAKKNNLLSKNIIAHENKPGHIWKYQACEPNEAVPVILYKNIQIVPINSKRKKMEESYKTRDPFHHMPITHAFLLGNPA